MSEEAGVDIKTAMVISSSLIANRYLILSSAASEVINTMCSGGFAIHRRSALYEREISLAVWRANLLLHRNHSFFCLGQANEPP